MTATLEQTIVKAESYLGVVENPPRSNRTTLQAECDRVWWLGFSRQGIAWCGTAVDLWVGRDLLPGSCFSTPNGAAAFKRIGAFDGNAEVGAVCFMTFLSNRGISHVGLVEGVNADGSVVNIEGNTSINGSQDNGGAVLHRHRYRNSIVGFGHVNYAQEDEEDDAMQLLRCYGYQDIYIVGGGAAVKAPDMPGVNELIGLKIAKPLAVLHDLPTFVALTGFNPAAGTPMPGE